MYYFEELRKITGKRDIDRVYRYPIAIDIVYTPMIYIIYESERGGLTTGSGGRRRAEGSARGDGQNYTNHQQRRPDSLPA